MAVEPVLLPCSEIPLAYDYGCVYAYAILLRKYRCSENSLVVIWFTDHHGKVKTAVCSATKPGSAFAARVELFTEGEISGKNAPTRAVSSTSRPSWPRYSGSTIPPSRRTDHWHRC